MSTQTESKINHLLHSYPKGAVLLSSWLTKEGYSLDLQKRYKSSRWLDSIGRGAMVRSGETVDYLGAIYALQAQPGWSVHPGGRSALSLLGKSQYLELSTQKAVLFADAKTNLPSWFKKYDWGLEINFYASSFLPPHLGLTTLDLNNFSIKVSGTARGIMECLFLAPKKQQLLEAYELMEGLNNLRPDLVQSLLEQCESVKVKRLFLYLAEKSEHDWFNYLNIKKIDLGKGKRSLVAGGVYIAKYQITVPKELEPHLCYNLYSKRKESKRMSSPKTLTSLRDKTNFIIKSREANYRASLRLEGFTVTSNTPPKGQSIKQLVEKYRVPVS